MVAVVVATQHLLIPGANVKGQGLNPWKEMPQPTSQKRIKCLSLFYSSHYSTR